MDRLDQLFARWLREIQPHSSELAETETDCYFINDAAGLLAATDAIPMASPSDKSLSVPVTSEPTTRSE